MKILKFRVWAENDANPKGRMYYPGDSVEPQVGNRKSEGVFILSAHGDLVTARSDQREESSTIWSRIANNNLRVMLFTGLKDKNGKEVYHKDIVASGKKHYTVGQTIFMLKAFRALIIVAV